MYTDTESVHIYTVICMCVNISKNTNKCRSISKSIGSGMPCSIVISFSCVWISYCNACLCCRIDLYGKMHLCCNTHVDQYVFSKSIASGIHVPFPRAFLILNILICIESILFWDIADMHTFVHIHTHRHTDTDAHHAHTHAHTHPHTRTYTRTRARARARAHTHTHTYLHTHVHTCMHTHINAGARAHPHTFTHAHTHNERTKEKSLTEIWRSIQTKCDYICEYVFIHVGTYKVPSNNNSRKSFVHIQCTTTTQTSAMLQSGEEDLPPLSRRAFLPSLSRRSITWEQMPETRHDYWPWFPMLTLHLCPRGHAWRSRPLPVLRIAAWARRGKKWAKDGETKESHKHTHAHTHLLTHPPTHLSWKNDGSLVLHTHKPRENMCHHVHTHFHTFLSARTWLFLSLMANCFPLLPTVFEKISTAAKSMRWLLFAAVLAVSSRW